MSASGTGDPYAMFNRSLEDFLEDLRPILGTVAEFGLVASSAKWLSKFDERKNQQLFHRYVVVPHEARVLAKDEGFFLDGGEAAIEGIGVVQLLKHTWRSGLQAEDRDAVWAHLRVLVALSKRCAALAGAA